jgi:hypothetical protein
MNKQDRTVASAIQRYEGIPNKRGRRGEAKRWSRFREWFISRFRRGDDLADDYVAAKVNEAQAEADIKREKVAEIAARTDLLKNKGVEKFCDIVDQSLPSIDKDLADALKLAKLLEANPAIAEQIGKIGNLVENLKEKRKVRIEPLEEGSPKILPSDTNRSDG